VQRQNLLELVLAFTLLLLAPKVLAQSRFELGTVLGGTTPTSVAPWLTATFSDITPGQVSLMLQSHLDVASEFIGEVALNLNPSFNPTSLRFLQITGPLLQGAPSLSANGIRLAGAGNLGGGFDVLLSWPTANGRDRLNGIETVSFEIRGPANLTASDFDFFNAVNGQAGAAIIGAHIQGIPVGTGTGGSGAVIQMIPEPSLVALFVMAIAAVGVGGTHCAKRGPGGRTRRAAGIHQ
jgi:hypothetical protein